MAMRKKKSRDVEKDYSPKHFVATLRRLADSIEQGKSFRIQVAGERILIPPIAAFSIEHERSDSGEEIEFQLTWPPQEQTPKVAGKKARNPKPY